MAVFAFIWVGKDGVKLGVSRLKPDAEGVNSVAPVFNWPDLPVFYYGYDIIKYLIIF